MRDIKGFCKLMDLSIPEYNEFDYYINQFARLEKYKHIKDMIPLYEEAESKYGDVFQLRIERSNQIVKFLEGTRAYKELIDDNLIPEHPTTKTFQYDEDKKYISIDMKMANWQVLKKYDPEFENELGDSYVDLLKRFDVPEIFFYSKQFRQYIFGNINPKRQGRAQRVMIQEVINKFSHLNLEVACIKNDEVIYSFESFDDIKEILSTIDNDKFKIKLFTVERVQDFRINSYMDKDGNFLYKEMIGCNGNKFFIYLKNYIFNEPLDIRDLYFRMDSSLAIWNAENLKLELK
jgi:hypothetical protein